MAFTTHARRRKGFPGILAAGLRAGAVLLVASCGSVPDGGTGTDLTESVVDAAFRNLDSRYVHDVAIADVSVAGLDAVTRSLPRARLVREAGTVSLLQDGLPVIERREPAAHDHRAWSALVNDFLAEGRNRWSDLARQDREDTLADFFRGGLSGLDRYTRYESPAEARNTRARREGFGGLGITIRYENGATYVRDVYPGTPAEKAGLLVGDRITHIGSLPLAGLSQAEVIAHLRGPVHSSADLTVERGEAPPTRIAVVRAHIVLPTVTASRAGGILILRITGFNQGTARSLGKELATAEREMGRDLRGIVLDLRSNPGGLLDQAVTVSDFFLNDGRIISTRGRHRAANQIFDASWGERLRDTPIALLVNGRSASASEIVAAALRDRGRAVVIGTSSFGKGSVQTIVRLPNGGELTMTWAHMIAPSGFSLQDHGIIPAICTSAEVRSTSELVRTVREPGRSGTGTAFVDVLTQRHALKSDPAKARRDCPPSSDERPEDAEIARYILENKVLYSRALTDGGPAIALGG
jgi:carboxyl-terminal processing protease